MAANKDSNEIKKMTAKEDAGAIEDIQVATPYKFSHDDAITLIVGPEETKMTVHSTYLARDSQFFKTALKKQWVEGQTRVIKLPEEDPEIMAHYMTFVYHSKLPFEGIVPKERGHFEARFTIMIDLYSSKEMLRLTHVICSEGLRWFPIGTNVATIYQGTPVGSPFRRLIVDMHVVHGSKDWLWANASADFLMDVTKAFYDRLGHHNAQSKLKEMELDARDYVSDA